MKPVDVKSSTYTKSGKENNDEDPKCKIGGKIRISKYKNIFAKGYTPNQSGEVFVIKKVKNTVPRTVINDLKGEEILEIFYKNNCKKQIKNSLKLKN